MSGALPPLGFGAATSTGRFLIIEFTPQGITAQQARSEMSNGLKLEATGLRQNCPWSQAQEFLSALPPMLENRTLIFSAAAGMPIDTHWQSLIEMLRLAGARNIICNHEPVYVRPLNEQSDRKPAPERPGTPTAPTPEPNIDLGL